MPSSCHDRLYAVAVKIINNVSTIVRRLVYIQKVSEKSSANVADIMAADASDDSLRKYKESLLGAAAQGDLGDVSDPRKLVVTEFRVIFEDASVPDAVFDLSSEVVHPY